MTESHISKSISSIASDTGVLVSYHAGSAREFEKIKLKINRYGN